MPTDPGAETVFVVESVHTIVSPEGRRTESATLMDEEGWFAERAPAQARAEQLSATLVRAYAQDEGRRRAEHAKRVADAELANRKAKVLRAAGIEEPYVRVPGPYEPRSLDRWLASLPTHTSYRVVAVPRSDHDTSG